MILSSPSDSESSSSLREDSSDSLTLTPPAPPPQLPVKRPHRACLLSQGTRGRTFKDAPVAAAVRSSAAACRAATRAARRLGAATIAGSCAVLAAVPAAPGASGSVSLPLPPPPSSSSLLSVLMASSSKARRATRQVGDVRAEGGNPAVVGTAARAGYAVTVSFEADADAVGRGWLIRSLAAAA